MSRTPHALFSSLLLASSVPPRSALRLHRDALVVDLHADTLLQVAEGTRSLGVRSRTGHVDLPRLRAGGWTSRCSRCGSRLSSRRTEATRGRWNSWSGSNRLADGVGGTEHGGLTPLGRQILARMQHLGIVVDVSHLSEPAFWQVLEATRGPIVATHSNAAAVHPHPRNLTDDQLQAIARRGGVVGVTFVPEFLGGASLGHVVRHVRHMVEVMGPDHVALGSDFDGTSKTPEGLTDVSHLPALTAALLQSGLRPKTIRKILGENALRVFRTVWGR